MRGIEIGYWHQLTINPETLAPRLSSRRLLVLLEKLPDSSEYKTAAERDGEFTELEQIAMETFNELARMHHTLQAVNADPEKWEDYDPPRFMGRLERIEYWRENRPDDGAEENEEIDF